MGNNLNQKSEMDKQIKQEIDDGIISSFAQTDEDNGRIIGGYYDRRSKNFY